jgi:hypothetical protein
MSDYDDAKAKWLKNELVDFYYMEAADTALAEKDKELARLREALEKIAKGSVENVAVTAQRLALAHIASEALNE